MTQTKLDHLLTENVDVARHRAATTFDQMVGPAPKIILFGSGELGRRTWAGAKKVGLNVVCFSDNNSKLWGTEIDGIQILSPEEAVQFFPEGVFVSTIWSAYVGHPVEEIRQQLASHAAVKVISFIYLYWRYPETFLPYWRCDLPHKTLEQFELASAAFSLWADEASQKEYFAQLFWRVTGDASQFTPPVKQDQYFPDDIFKLTDHEVFVDVGAFDGDTLKVFLDKCGGKFDHYYAYEPDPFGCQKLEEFVQATSAPVADRLTIQPVGIGKKSEKIKIQTPGVYFRILYPEEAQACSPNGKAFYIDVDSQTLDGLALQHPPTFVKMDVEGFEPDVIFGAKELIKKHNPVIAISIYHQFDHIWRLPLAVRALSDNYRFYLRPHFHAGWELICYAVPKDRVLLDQKLKNH